MSAHHLAQLLYGRSPCGLRPATTGIFTDNLEGVRLLCAGFAGSGRTAMERKRPLIPLRDAKPFGWPGDRNPREPVAGLAAAGPGLA
jgi:hypothetical protein